MNVDSIDAYLMCISIIIRAYIRIKFAGESFRLVKIINGVGILTMFHIITPYTKR
jgi:hypothetical protein